MTDQKMIGRSVLRKEDSRLLAGGGRYTDDIRLDGELVGVVRRSDVAAGTVTRISAAKARAMPGVHLVLTASELPQKGAVACSLPVKSRNGDPIRTVSIPALARDRVLYVGEPVAVVIAESLQEARDAVDAIEVEIDASDAVTDAAAALEPGAPLLHAGIEGNLSLDWEGGDSDAVDAAIARADHVVQARLVNNRVVVASMEPRGALARYDASSERFTIQLGCQGVFGMRGALAGLMGVKPEKIHVLTGDVGGSFGMKAGVYPEYIAILHAARELGRPVRWIDDRSGAFLSDAQGRDSVFDCTLALDKDGRMLAARAVGVANLGAYASTFGPLIPTVNILKNMPGPYRLPAIHIHTRCAVTNTTPTNAYRGAGRPEGVYLMERLIDLAARRTGIDPVSLRRRNLIGADEMPYKTASGLVYDSGEFERVLDRGLEAADVEGFPSRRKETEARGRRLGIAVTTYLEVTAPPSKEMGGIAIGEDGRVTLTTGTLDYGQGHSSTFAQILSDELGVPFEHVDLVQKDSDQLIAGGGTGGSRSVMASGAAILAAAELVIEKGRGLAADHLEAAVQDIDFENGHYLVKGTDRRVAILDIARVHIGHMDSSLTIDTPPSAYPNGCHIAEVEVDPATGVARLTRYTAIDDFGSIINPMLTKGQVHGGVVQGIGQALFEQVVHDQSGQLLTGSFMDYTMPRADNSPSIEVDFVEVPAKTNPLGVKGCGEAGCTGALPTVMNALIDALAPLGVEDLDMPATPQRIWQAIDCARGKAA